MRAASRPVVVALLLLAGAVGLACSSLLGIEDAEVTSRAEGGSEVSSPSDADASTTPSDDAADAAPVVPFCPRDASFCADFSNPNVALDWNATENPTLGQLEQSPEGAMQSGSLQVTVPQFAGSQSRESIYLRRTIGNLAGAHTHVEMAVRTEAVPNVGDTAPFRLFVGNALFYAYVTQAGWRIDDGYYGTPCGAGPCGGGQHSGTQPVVPLHTWERISLDIALPDGGARYVATFEALPSHESISFSLSTAFVPGVTALNYLGVGITSATPATIDRKLLIDDIALTISPF
jgi:hypothetical protein